MQIDTVGKVISVSGHLVKVEIDRSRKSAVQSSLDGVQAVVAINSYLTFDIGAGDLLLGIVTDLFAQEGVTLDNDFSELQFSQPKRVAFVQLLGTLRSKKGNEFEFSPSVTIMPTLDSHAFIASVDVLRSVFTNAPKRALLENKPNSDGKIEIGQPLGTTTKEAKAYGSFNDLFSRPLAVVGNTGSGKSYTIASLLHQAIEGHQQPTPKFFILDINGEYSHSFGKKTHKPEPNTIFVNGEKFAIPAWLMNSREICDWLRAGEGVQQPVLKNFWALAKSGKSSEEQTIVYAKQALDHLKNFTDNILTGSGTGNGARFYVANNTTEAGSLWNTIKALISIMGLNDQLSTQISAIETQFSTLGQYSSSFGSTISTIQPLLIAMQANLESKIAETADITKSSDDPVYFAQKTLEDPKHLFDEAIRGESENNIRNFIQTVKLRLQNRVQDKRWNCLTKYDSLLAGCDSITKWLDFLGIASEPKSNPHNTGTGGNEVEAIKNHTEVCIIDCSMLAHEVLPYVCGIIGRLLLEVRSHADADQRHRNPWVVVLEEAHNYIRPRRQDEDAGLTISRDSFERIAKEGRKFGLSLMVASQRPSEISPTVLSQCANYIIHRLQNPDDIGHFKDVVPSQSRRLLDQVMLFGSGEAILVGSAFHIPARVTIRPLASKHEPKSKTACPFYDWKNHHEDGFNLSSALQNWVGKNEKTED